MHARDEQVKRILKREEKNTSRLNICRVLPFSLFHHHNNTTTHEDGKRKSSAQEFRFFLRRKKLATTILCKERDDEAKQKGQRNGFLLL